MAVRLLIGCPEPSRIYAGGFGTAMRFKKPLKKDGNSIKAAQPGGPDYL